MTSGSDLRRVDDLHPELDLLLRVVAAAVAWRTTDGQRAEALVRAVDDYLTAADVNRQPRQP